GSDIADDSRERIFLTIVGVNTVADDIVDDFSLRQRLPGRAVISAANEGHADLQLSQLRIIQRANPQVAIGAIDQNVTGSVIWTSRNDPLKIRRHAQHQLGRAVLDSVTKKSAPLRPPGVFDLRAEV